MLSYFVQFFHYGPEIRPLADNPADLRYGYALLGHGIAVADGHAVVLLGLMVHGDAEGSADGILTAVSLADAVLLVILAVEVKLQVVDDIAGNLRQPVLLDQRQYCKFHGSQHGRNAEDYPLLWRTSDGCPGRSPCGNECPRAP